MNGAEDCGAPVSPIELDSRLDSGMAEGSVVSGS